MHMDLGDSEIEDEYKKKIKIHKQMWHSFL